MPFLSAQGIAELTGADFVPFGTEIGRSFGVPAYSNETSGLISDEINENLGVFSGMKWQCVEYARRFMQTVLGATFAGVYGAQNIWFLDTASRLEDGASIPFATVPNGSSDALPEVGSLLIYPISENCPFGHVAVVVKADPESGLVYLAEQNWDSRVWPKDRSYSRTVQVEKTSRGTYFLRDESGEQILGWKTVGLLTSRYPKFSS